MYTFRCCCWAYCTCRRGTASSQPRPHLDFRLAIRAMIGTDLLCRGVLFVFRRGGRGKMAGKSWEFRGETKDWDNVWDHKWIRSNLVVGWSAAGILHASLCHSVLEILSPPPPCTPLPQRTPGSGRSWRDEDLYPQTTYMQLRVGSTHISVLTRK